MSHRLESPLEPKCLTRCPLPRAAGYLGLCTSPPSPATLSPPAEKCQRIYRLLRELTCSSTDSTCKRAMKFHTSCRDNVPREDSARSQQRPDLDSPQVLPWGHDLQARLGGGLGLGDHPPVLPKGSEQGCSYIAWSVRRMCRWGTKLRRCSPAILVSGDVPVFFTLEIGRKN